MSEGIHDIKMYIVAEGLFWRVITSLFLFN